MCMIMTVLMPISYSAHIYSGKVYYIMNKNSKKYITVSSNNYLVQKPLDNTENQRFLATRVETINGIDYYEFVSDKDHNLYIDVDGAADINNTLIKVYNKNDSFSHAQRFRLIANPDGKTYKIMPKLSQTRVIEVQNCSTANNAAIQLFSRHPDNHNYSPAQEWYIYYAKKSIITWNCVDSGKHLDWQATTKYENIIPQAAAVWNGYKSGVIRKDNVLSLNDVTISDNAGLGGSAALTYPEGRIELNTTVLDSCSQNARLNTIIHELGHALGMGHLNRSDNVINWFMNETVVLDDFNRNSYDMAYSNY